MNKEELFSSDYLLSELLKLAPGSSREFSLPPEHVLYATHLLSGRNIYLELQQGKYVDQVFQATGVLEGDVYHYDENSKEEVLEGIERIKNYCKLHKKGCTEVMELTGCEFTESILQAVNLCLKGEPAVVCITDGRGETSLWVEAEWVTLPDEKHEVVEVQLCFSDTGKCAYGKCIKETMRKKNKKCE